jgi:hypothetical protein
MFTPKSALAALLVAFALQAPVVLADDEHEHDNGPCKADREKLCKDAPPGRGVFQCLRQHESELSDACKTALQHRGHGHHHGGADAGT